jgi:NADH-quinone oxidoreductase subunit C
MSKKLLDLLKAKFGDAILETHSQFGDDTAVVAPAAWREVALFLRDDPRCAMSMFTDLCGVDYPDREPRFEVVCHLRSLQHAHRIRIKARVGDERRHGRRARLARPGVEGRQLVRARDLRHDRRDLHGPPGSAADLDVPRVPRAPAAQGLPGAEGAAPRPLPRGQLREAPPFGLDEGMSFGRQTHTPEFRGRRSAETHAARRELSDGTLGS